MTIPKITPLPTAMNRMRPNTFSVESDTYFGALEQKFAPEMNAVVDAVNLASATVDSNAIVSTLAAQNAASSAATAQYSANASPWTSGTTYAINTVAISQVNFQTYRKRTASAASNIDPANDATNWVSLGPNGAFTIVNQATTTFDLATGNYYKRTVSGNETWSFINFPYDGFSWTVEVTLTSGSVTLPTSVKTPGNIPYTFNSGKTHMFMFVTSNKGTRIRLVAASNFDN